MSNYFDRASGKIINMHYMLVWLYDLAPVLEPEWASRCEAVAHNPRARRGCLRLEICPRAFCDEA